MAKIHLTAIIARWIGMIILIHTLVLIPLFFINGAILYQSPGSAIGLPVVLSGLKTLIGQVLTGFLFLAGSQLIVLLARRYQVK